MGVCHGRSLSSFHCPSLAVLLGEDPTRGLLPWLLTLGVVLTPADLLDVFGELVSPQPGSNPCSSSHELVTLSPSAWNICSHPLLEWLQEQCSWSGDPAAAPVPHCHCLSPWRHLCLVCPACGMSHRLGMRPQADEVGMGAPLHWRYSL